MSGKKTAGASYHGYDALRTTTGSWSNHSNRPIEVYRTEIMTPYSLGLDRERLSQKLQNDLQTIFDEIRLFSKAECDKRAFNTFPRPWLIGCMATKDWKQDRWIITLITREDFDGFPAA